MNDRPVVVGRRLSEHWLTLDLEPQERAAAYHVFSDVAPAASPRSLSAQKDTPHGDTACLESTTTWFFIGAIAGETRVPIRGIRPQDRGGFLAPLRQGR
jgi:hypothetical protein